MRQGAGRKSDGKPVRKAGTFRPLSDVVAPGVFAAGSAVMLELLRSRWKALAGEGLWAYSWPMSLSETRVTVAVDSVAALTAVRGLRNKVIERIRVIPSMKGVRSLAFRVDPEFMAMARSGSGDPAISGEPETSGASGSENAKTFITAGGPGSFSAEGVRLSEENMADKPELSAAFRRFTESIDRAMSSYSEAGYSDCRNCGNDITPGGRLCFSCKAKISDERLLKVENLLLGVPWFSMGEVAERFPGTTLVEYSRARQWVSEILERKMWDAFYAYVSKIEKVTYMALETAVSSVAMLATGLKPDVMFVCNMNGHVPQEILKALAGGK